MWRTNSAVLSCIIVQAIALVPIFSTPLSAMAIGLKDAVAAYERQDYRQALKDFTQLAERRSPTAQYHLGLMYEHGRGVPKDLKTAFSRYQAASFRAYAVLGTSHCLAKMRLAEMYERGHGTEVNKTHAARWVKHAANLGHPIAQVKVAERYMSGSGAERNPWRAYVWLSVAAERGHEPAGVMRDQVAHELRDASRAREMFKTYPVAPKQPPPGVPCTEMARVGDARAEYSLARHYLSGTTRKPRLSEELFRSLAKPRMRLDIRSVDNKVEKTRYAALVGLGDLYSDPANGMYDMPAALSAYETASSAGVAKAHLALSRVFESGHGVDQDLAKAESYLRKLNERPPKYGFPVKPTKLFTFELAEFYFRQHRPAKAYVWYSIFLSMYGKHTEEIDVARAHELRNQIETASLSLERLMEAQRDAKAARTTIDFPRWEIGRCFEERCSYAMTGDPYKLEVLGNKHADGVSTPPNYIEAFAWLSLAVSRGRNEALAKLNRITKRMTMDAIEAGKQRMAELSPHVPKMELKSEEGDLRTGLIEPDSNVR